MTMGTLSDRAWERLSGESWNALRASFLRVNDALLSVSPEAFADLTTIYIKYSVSPSPTSPVYAVVWVKTAKQFVVGLALPENVSAPELTGPPQGMKYKGLTRYLVVRPGDAVPAAVDQWARLAFDFVIETAQHP